jgi:hypothetical protein
MTEVMNPQDPPHPPKRSGGTVLAFVVAVLALAGGAIATVGRAVTNSEMATTTGLAPSFETFPDERLRQQIVGTWRLVDQGERIVTNRPDGTATMVVRLTFLGSLLYGDRLDFELTWAVQDGVLTHAIVSGKPKANVDRLIRDFGSSMSSRILSLDERVLYLEETDGSGDRYRWTRWSEAK